MQGPHVGPARAQVGVGTEAEELPSESGRRLRIAWGQKGQREGDAEQWVHRVGQTVHPEVLTDARRSGLAAVVQEGHVGQSVAIVHAAASLQDLCTQRERGRETLGTVVNTVVE